MKMSKDPIFVAKCLLGLGALAVLAVLALGSTSYFFAWSPRDSDQIVAAIEKIAIAGDLDQLFFESESRVVGLKRGMAKGLVWFDMLAKAKTRYAIIYLHGFSASRMETMPVADIVAKKLSANIFYTRMRAHGLVDGEDFANLQAQDLVDSAREALAVGRRIGEKIIIIGMSTGALLALQLALENQDKTDIAALVLLSPNYRPHDWRSQYIAGPLGRWLARITIGTHREFVPSNAQHALLWTSRYRSEGVVAMMDLVNYVRRSKLAEIQLPILSLYTHHDQAVDVGLIVSVHEEFGSTTKKIFDLPGATRHELASKAIAPEMVEPAANQISDWLAKVL